MRLRGLLLAPAVVLALSASAFAQAGAAGRADAASAHFDRAASLFSGGKAEEAAESLRQALRLRPDFAEAYSNLGLVYVALEAYADAAEALTRSVRLRPEGRVYQHLGFALYKLGRPEKAAAAFKRATLLTPKDATTRYNLGVVCLELDMKAEALKQHKELQALDAGLARKLYREIYKDKILDVSRDARPR